jgi:hypothetical protein
MQPSRLTLDGEALKYASDGVPGHHPLNEVSGTGFALNYGAEIVFHLLRQTKIS